MVPGTHCGPHAGSIVFPLWSKGPIAVPGTNFGPVAVPRTNWGHWIPVPDAVSVNHRGAIVVHGTHCIPQDPLQFSGPIVVQLWSPIPIVVPRIHCVPQDPLWSHCCSPGPIVVQL